MDLFNIEQQLRAVIAQLDDAGEMLAAAYAELALGVLSSVSPRPPLSPPIDDPTGLAD